MDNFNINPGSLLFAKADIFGSGIDFNQFIKKEQILLFINREVFIKENNVFVYHFIQEDKQSCIVCPQSKFDSFFDVVYLGKNNEKQYNKNRKGG